MALTTFQVVALFTTVHGGSVIEFLPANTTRLEKNTAGTVGDEEHRAWGTWGGCTAGAARLTSILRIGIQALAGFSHTAIRYASLVPCPSLRRPILLRTPRTLRSISIYRATTHWRKGNKKRSGCGKRGGLRGWCSGSKQGRVSGRGGVLSLSFLAMSTTTASPFFVL